MSFFAIYYRSEREDIINARKVDEAANDYVQQQARTFAAMFDAVPYFAPGLATHFVGIGFAAPPRQQGLWAPAIPGNPLRRPADQRKVPQKLRAQHAVLAAKWNTHMPTAATKPRDSELLKVLGVSKDDYTGGHQLHLFMDGDAIWLISTVPLEGLTEMLGTDVREAQDRVEKAAAAKVAEATEEAKALVVMGQALAEGAAS